MKSEKIKKIKKMWNNCEQSFFFQIVVACLVACTLAQSQNSAQFEDDKKIRTSTYIPIIKQSKDQGQDGSYNQA